MRNPLSTNFLGRDEKIADLKERIAGFEKRIAVQTEVIEESRAELARIGSVSEASQEKANRLFRYMEDAGEAIAFASRMIVKLNGELLQEQGA